MWNERRNKTLRWKEGWKLKSFYATPRDQVTWLKLQHRTLHTVGHMTTGDTSCTACTAKENRGIQSRKQGLQTLFWAHGPLGIHPYMHGGSWLFVVPWMAWGRNCYLRDYYAAGHTKDASKVH